MPWPSRYAVRTFFGTHMHQASMSSSRSSAASSAASRAVADRVAGAYVDREARKGKGPSDHAPVVVDLS